MPSIGEVEQKSVLPWAPRQSPEELVCTQPNQLPQVLHLEKYILRFQPQNAHYRGCLPSNAVAEVPNQQKCVILSVCSVHPVHTAI